MELKLCFFFLLLHVIHVQSLEEWLVNVPKKISVVENSCMIIPCTYTFPWHATTPRTLVRTGFWKYGSEIVASSRPGWEPPTDYRHRTHFLGNLYSLNCTMLMERVRRTDAGLIHFRIEMDLPRSYSFVLFPVDIEVLSTPPPPSMTVHGTIEVSVACSVTHSCPRSLPTFIWSRSENTIFLSRQVTAWQWRTTSILIFRPGIKTSKKTLYCTVAYSGGKRATTSVVVSM